MRHPFPPRTAESLVAFVYDRHGEYDGVVGFVCPLASPVIRSRLTHVG